MSRSINDTHVTFDGSSVFNKTLLDEFQYHIYSNGTLSNSSRCVLIFGRYLPVMLPNGTIVNGTKCDIPIRPIGVRGGLGILFSILFAFAVCGASVCLRKHGASHLPEDKSTRFHLLSRKSQWYWIIFTSILGCISGFMAIDVDRDYVPGVAIVLQSIFYYSLLPATLAAAWEMTRHWAYFQERIIQDEDPHFFPPDDRRSKLEFYMPLVFYLFAFLTFFLSVLRKWSPISRQSPYAATDGRFKASSIMSLIAFLVVSTFSLISQHFYRRRIPNKILLCLSFLLIRIIYNIISAWSFNNSPLKYNVNNGYIYGLGYAPTLLAISTMIISGLAEENEDLIIKRNRKKRTELLDISAEARPNLIPLERGETIGTFGSVSASEQSAQKPPPPPYSEIS